MNNTSRIVDLTWIAAIPTTELFQPSKNIIVSPTSYMGFLRDYGHPMKA